MYMYIFMYVTSTQYMYMYKHVKSLWVITLSTTAYAKVIGTYTVYDL